MLFESNSDFFFSRVFILEKVQFPPTFTVVSVYIMYIRSGYIAVILSATVAWCKYQIYRTKYCNET